MKVERRGADEDERMRKVEKKRGEEMGREGDR